MKQLTVVKIGGNIIDDAERLDAFLKDFAGLEGSKILVHGGGKIASEIGLKLGIEAQYVNGRRVTDEDTLSLVTMVYGGLINKNIVARLQAIGTNALGLSGCDGNVVRAVKRQAVAIDYGFAGDVLDKGVNVTLLDSLLQAGIVPVLAPLTHDGHGNMLNTNADTIAQETAKAFSGIAEVQLIYCLEKPGVLSDANDDNSVIPVITKASFSQLVATGIITAGMIPKLENAFTALENGVTKVIIGRGEDLPLLLRGQRGTHIS